MSFLRRLFGGEGNPDAASDHGDPATPAPTQAELVAEEQARDRELLRADAERMSDDLIQRQLRYSDRSWTPPTQGGTRRADDEEGAEE